MLNALTGIPIQRVHQTLFWRNVHSLVEPVMEATLMSSWDGVSGVIRANVFTGFARAVGFLHMASGGDGWLNKDVMSVGPWLLVCLSGLAD